MGRTLFILKSSSRRAPPSIGVTVLNDLLVMVSVRSEPLRITGIYRHDLSSDTPTHSAHDTLLRKALRRGRRALCLPRGAAVTVALQPQDARLSLRFDQAAAAVRVRCRPTLPRLLNEAGFGAASFDALPISLARAALCGSREEVSLDHRSGWRIRSTAERVDAQWCVDAGREAEIHESIFLGGIEIPATLRAVVRVGLDAGALGAALSAAGISPHVGQQVAHDVIDLRGGARLQTTAIA